MIIYLMGSLNNSDTIQEMGNILRNVYEYEVYDDWIAHGPDIDLFWRDYEIGRGRSYKEALQGEAGRAMFELDREWLNKCDCGLLVYPAGKSAHTELGYLIGRGTPCHVIMQEEPEKWDLMLRFATGVHQTLAEFQEALVASGGTIQQGTLKLEPTRLVPRRTQSL